MWMMSSWFFTPSPARQSQKRENLELEEVDSNSSDELNYEEEVPDDDDGCYDDMATDTYQEPWYTS